MSSKLHRRYNVRFAGEEEEENDELIKVPAKVTRKQDNKYIERKSDSKKSKSRKLCPRIRKPSFSFFFVCQFITADIKSRPTNYCVGICSIITVATIISLFSTIIMSSSLVFLRVTENQVGEIDVLFTSTFGLLNQTLLDEKLEGNEYLEGSSPRFLFRGLFSKLDLTENEEIVPHEVYVLLLDTELEESLGIGRAFEGRVLGETEEHVLNTIVQLQGLEEQRGQRSVIKIELPEFLMKQVNEYSSEYQEILDNEYLKAVIENPFFISFLEATLGFGNVSQVLESLFQPDFQYQVLMDLTLINEITSPGGKYPDILGNIVLADIRAVKKVIQDLLDTMSIFPSPNQPQNNDEYNRMDPRNPSFDVKEYAFMSVGKLRDRFSLYSLPKKERDQKFIQISNSLKTSLGGPSPVPVRFSFPISQLISSYEFIQFFLEQILVEAMVIFMFVSVIVLTNLFLLNQKMKVFQFGILRSIGFKKTGFLSLYICSTLTFSVPSVVLVLIISFFLNSFFEILLNELYIHEKKSVFQMFSKVSPTNIIFVILIVIGIPLIANILPIYYSLGQDLLTSLNPMKNTNNALSKVKIATKKLSRFYGLQTTHLVFAICCVTVGFVMFYIVPLSFIFEDFSIFFYLMDFTFLVMIFCFSLLCQILMPYVELFLIFFILIFHYLFINLLFGCISSCCNLYCKSIDHPSVIDEDDEKFFQRNNTNAVRVLLSKNLDSHRPQNRKTFLVCLVCITLIVFAGVGIDMYAVTLKSTTEMAIGSDILIETQSKNVPLVNSRLINFLENREYSGRRELEDDEMTLEYNNIRVSESEEDEEVVGTPRNKNKKNIVESFSFVSFSLDEVVGVLGSTYVSTLSRYPNNRNRIYAISENYLETCENSVEHYYVPTEINTALLRHMKDNEKEKEINGKINVIHSLYNHQGIARPKYVRSVSRYSPESVLVDICQDNVCSNDFENKLNQEKYTNAVEVILPQSLHEKIGVDSNSPILIELNLNKYCFGLRRSDNFNCSDILMGLPIATVRRFPGFFISSYETLARDGPIFVSFDQFFRIVNYTNHMKCQLGWGPNLTDNMCFERIQSRNNIPMKKCLIRLREDVIEDEILTEKFINDLKVHIDSDYHMVYNVQSLKRTIDMAVISFHSFFYCIGVLCFFFCMIMLSVNFYSNVIQDSYTSGVLRAIGLSVNEIVLLYGYEAIVIVLSSFICGLVLGCVAGIVMVYQLNIFMEMTFQFKFPYPLILGLLVTMIICAVLGTLCPMVKTKKQRISQFLK